MTVLRPSSSPPECTSCLSARNLNVVGDGVGGGVICRAAVVEWTPSPPLFNIPKGAIPDFGVSLLSHSPFFPFVDREDMLRTLSDREGEMERDVYVHYTALQFRLSTCPPHLSYWSRAYTRFNHLHTQTTKTPFVKLLAAF